MNKETENLTHLSYKIIKNTIEWKIELAHLKNRILRDLKNTYLPVVGVMISKLHFINSFGWSPYDFPRKILSILYRFKLIIFFRFTYLIKGTWIMKNAYNSIYNDSNKMWLKLKA